MTNKVDDLREISLRHLAARAAESFRKYTHYWIGSWRDRQLLSVLNELHIEVTIFNLGPSIRIGTPVTFEPEEVFRFNTPLINIFSKTEIQNALGIDVNHILTNEPTWGLRIKLSNINWDDLDPSSTSPAVTSNLIESPIVGPYLLNRKEDFLKVLALAADIGWTALQADVLTERAFVDISGRTASEEASRYWLDYTGAAGGQLQSAWVGYDAIWREDYLSLARKVRQRDPELAAEYLKIVLDMLVTNREVICSPTFTQAVNCNVNNDPFMVSKANNYINPATYAASIRQEFKDLESFLSMLNAKVGVYLIHLSNQMEEGIAVWIEFMISVLIHQKAIQPLTLPFYREIDTPADVIGKYDNISEDNDYLIGFRNTATVALNGTPWFLSNINLAASALRGPLELVKTRLPASELFQLQINNPIAPDERLRKLMVTGIEESNENGWIEAAYKALKIGPMKLSAIIEQTIDNRRK